MVEIDEWRFEPQSDRLYFHFDVSEHFLKLDTFIRTADSARKIIDSFNEDFFHPGLFTEIELDWLRAPECALESSC